MQEQIDSLQAALQDKRMWISNAGSIAEAAAAITNLFSVAQETANLYLHEISSMKAETEKQCAKMLEDAGQKVAFVACHHGDFTHDAIQSLIICHNKPPILATSLKTGSRGSKQ